MSKKEYILDLIDDLVSDFLYYDRKEDEKLKIDEIKNSIDKNEITIYEIIDKFKECLIKGLR